ncbi:non-homologous end-joining DNA ligase [soil metagenome]
MGSTAEHGEPVELEVAGRTVTISSPDKVMFPERGETKLDLARYYLAVGDAILPTLLDRPVLLERYPDGVRGNSFFQKRIPAAAPDWLTTTTVRTINGTESRALVIADLAHVLWASNIGCLGLHVWPFRARSPEVADELRIDLDPSPGVTFDQVREAAGHVRDFLATEGITSYAKTTGSKGTHVYVRVEPNWDSFGVRGAAIAVAREMELRHPDLLTDKWWKEERGQRVFVDFNQNAPHKNVFGAWCVRARVGAQVSTPVSWDELDTVDPESLTIATVPDRLADHGDPWADMDDRPQSIDHLVERFTDRLADGVPDAPWPPQYPKMPNEAPRVAPSRARRP